METKQAKKLEQVRALLAKADSTKFPAEAETFRAKANELMTAYAIEAWMVEEGKEADRPEPEQRTMDISWYWSSKRKDELWSLFHKVARHCRCKVIWWEGYRDQPVVGLPADLDYMDLLFTSLMLELGKGLEPKPDASESIAENAYRMRMAGVSRERIGEMMWEAGLVELPKGHLEDRYGNLIDSVTPWSRLADGTRRAVRQRLRSALLKYARECGLPEPKVHPGVFQRSYAQGFVAEVGLRMRNQRAAEEQRMGGSGSGMEVALRDIRAVVEAAATEMFGAEPKTRGRSLGQQAHSAEAYQTGRVAGSRANISGSPPRGLRARRADSEPAGS